MGKRVDSASLRTFLFLFLLLLSCSFTAHSQEKSPLSPFFRVYPAEETGASSFVLTAEKDPNGTVWFGTAGKILRYDGAQWKSFSVPSGMNVMAIELDSAGRVFVGGQGELGYLKPRGMEGSNGEGNGHGLKYVSLTDQLPEPYRSFDIVREIIIDDKGRVHFKSDRHLFIYDEGKFRIPEKYEPDQVRVLNGRTWLFDEQQGVYRSIPDSTAEPGSDAKGLAFEKISGSDEIKEWELKGVLDSVPGIPLEEDELLLLTHKHGIFRYRYAPGKGGQRYQPLSKAGNDALIGGSLYGWDTLNPSRNPYGASLILHSIQNGIILVGADGRPVTSFTKEGGLPSNFIWDLERGSGGGFWMTTNNGIAYGLFEDPRSYAWEGKGFEGVIRDIAHYQGHLFLATSQGIYAEKKGSGDGIPKPSDWTLLEGSKYQSTHLEKVDGRLFARSGTPVELISEDGEWKVRSFYDIGLTALREVPTPLDGIVLGTANSSVFSLLWETPGGGVESVLQIRDLPDGVLTFASRMRKGMLRIWVGHRTKGVSLIEVDSSFFSRPEAFPLDTTFQAIQNPSSPDPLVRSYSVGKSGLPDEGETRIINLEGRIRATTDSGLFRPVLSQKPHFVPDTLLGCSFTPCEEEGGRSFPIFKMGKDPSGSYWVSAGEKLFRLSRRKGELRIDSLPFLDIGLGVFHVGMAAEGALWFGGANGILRFDPGIPKRYDRSFPCLIREVRVSLKRKEEEVEAKDSILFAGDHWVPSSDTILPWHRVEEQPKEDVPELPYALNGLTFRFASPFHEKEKGMRYRYRLEGFDPAWSKWTQELKKEYTNLPEGSYRFKVKARNSYGKISSTASYRFRILPPWYRTAPAYFAYGILGVLFIGLLIRLNARRLVRQKRKLEQEVERATSEIRKKNEDLEYAYEEVSHQKEQLEEAHAEITDSINYAKRIQDALLQSEEYVSTHLPPHFVLFRPKSVVSGDIYWTREKEGYLYFAAVDCTGHGVPGAMMSMLGISLLNEILGSEGVPEPGVVLDGLQQRVVEELGANSEGKAAYDGMDLSLVRIDLDRLSKEEMIPVSFSGANNPLYLLGDDIPEDPASLLEKEEEFDRVRAFEKRKGLSVQGDKRSIGYADQDGGSFHTIQLKLPYGSMLYLFSDGYADQFGGPKGKKFRYRPFRELLNELRGLPVEAQKQQLETRIQKWMDEGNTEQIDDMVVIGIRLEVGERMGKG